MFLKVYNLTSRASEAPPPAPCSSDRSLSATLLLILSQRRTCSIDQIKGTESSSRGPEERDVSFSIVSRRDNKEFLSPPPPLSCVLPVGGGGDESVHPHGVFFPSRFPPVSPPLCVCVWFDSPRAPPFRSCRTRRAAGCRRGRMHAWLYDPPWMITHKYTHTHTHQIIRVEIKGHISS